MSLKYQSRTLATAPTVEPVTLDEAKDHMRISGSDDDTYITQLIKAARGHTEMYLSRALVAQTWDIYYDSLPPSDFVPLEIPLPPLISVTHIKYQDNNNDQQTWDNSKYVVDTDSFTGKVYPVYGETFPTTFFYPKAVVVRAVCGYENSGASPVDLADNVPDDIKQAILMHIAHLYENRESTTPGIEVKTVPMGYKDLLTNYKVRSFG